MLFNREHNIEDVTVRQSINNESRIVLYAGTFEPYQGLELIVDAAPAVITTHADVRFICLGGNRNQITALQSRAHHRGVVDYFIFPGTVPSVDVEQYFKVASILVSPRISGINTPLKIYSYLRSGVPIVATNIIAHKQVLSDEVAVLVEPSSGAIAAGILSLLNNVPLSRRLAQNAIRLAHELYDPEKYYDKIATVLSFLSAKARAGNEHCSSSPTDD